MTIFVCFHSYKVVEESNREVEQQQPSARLGEEALGNSYWLWEDKEFVEMDGGNSFTGYYCVFSASELNT